MSPGSSPGAGDLGDVFVFNDLRKGGPLSERGAGRLGNISRVLYGGGLKFPPPKILKFNISFGET